MVFQGYPALKLFHWIFFEIVFVRVVRVLAARSSPSLCIRSTGNLNSSCIDIYLR